MLSRWIVLIISALSLQGCLTYKWKVVGVHDSLFQPYKVPRFIDVSETAKPNHFVFKNNSQSTVFISHRNSVAIANGRSYRLISGRMNVNHRDMESPDIPIAAGTSIEVSFYSDDRSFTKLVNEDQQIVDYRVFLKTPRKSYSMSLRSVGSTETFITSDANDNDSNLCYLTEVFFYGYCWFVSPDEADESMARMKAQSMYGDQVDVIYQERNGFLDDL
ncbi:hypothetical protein [Pseudobacteriovorax antillogorgiicola]|uniref:Lipoprotein n=1 Tax=Pseudobacteriovorax antillogorgiicola TaxID=1513793 RepID=A0A1Y6B7E5_9BACT|nr:hypothetical protein [Pseudobacteriovorax antillogorgiicola]TCS58837.1 hypothetical protein EDD56_102352 [Pseudobacteriovorax antillogorgiicola]SME94100.1 hypothetical protein SAMN06296036_10291 [Pseudobacteriovorax antillogorgiicola]